MTHVAETLILNVDDTEAALYAKSRVLRHAGFDVIEAATGGEALRLVDDRQPALVLLDVKLPDINGLEVCKRIKDRWPEILVLQISASFVAADDRVRGLEGGADSYLTQPVASNELVASVRALLRIRVAEAALRESKAHLQGILSSATDYAIISMDRDGRVTKWSAGAEAVFGWSEDEAIGKSLAFIFPEEDRAADAPEQELEIARETGRAEDKRWHLRRDGSRLFANGVLTRLESDAPDGGFVKVLRDQTEQKRAEQALIDLNATLESRVLDRTRDLEAANDRLRQEIAERGKAEEQLRQSQKMEAVGQLTGGVAHDFNNLLQIVTGNLETILRNLPEDAARLRRAGDNALNGAKRAATLTQRLLAFSRQQPLSPQSISLNQLVSGMTDLLNRALGETIELESVLAGGLWRTEVDPNQLESAILNLAVNARDAMPDGGKLTIETANTRLDEVYSRQTAEVIPGQYVVICVSDTGSGMTPETAKRAFEPFFTTKDVGRGTGLGLSQVYGFVKQSGGHVKIYSEPGHGTTVKIYLPRLLGAVEEEETPREQIAPEGTHAETILVIEDDDDVRAYSVEVLRELGYRVLEAHDGASALRLLERQDEGAISLLFTDVVLPGGATGREVAEAARKIAPGLKVLFTTGYARDAIVHQGRLDPGVDLITKPFTFADLAGKVRDVLDA